MKGGRIQANNDGTFYGINATGRADAAFINYLGIRWYGDGNPDLPKLYRYPDSRVNGFDYSITDAIYYFSELRDVVALFEKLDRMLKARETDAVEHHLNDENVIMVMRMYMD